VRIADGADAEVFVHGKGLTQNLGGNQHTCLLQQSCTETVATHMSVEMAW
jgi:hypothetical protein